MAISELHVRLNSEDLVRFIAVAGKVVGLARRAGVDTVEVEEAIRKVLSSLELDFVREQS